jgi:hypothetical protein
MRKITSLLLGFMAILSGSSPGFAGVYYTMVINFIPNPGACQEFINSGALYMAVNPGVPNSLSRDERTQALVNSNSTVALLNAHPGYTVVVPALKEDVFCDAKCAIANINCWKACKFAVNNFYSVQKPTYTVPNGTIFVRCPTLNMSKYPYYPSDPYTKFPYNR